MSRQERLSLFVRDLNSRRPSEGHTARTRPSHPLSGRRTHMLPRWILLASDLNTRRAPD
jgi:hypothetical protein